MSEDEKQLRKSKLPWAYRCSICEELVDVDDMTSHLEKHKAEPDWPGSMSWKRVDR